MSRIWEVYLLRVTGKNIGNNSGNCHIVGIDQIMMSPIELLKINVKDWVVLPGASSAWIYIWASVPQGSILGSVLFLVYNSDIVDGAVANTSFLADDTSLFFILVEDPDSCCMPKFFMNDKQLMKSKHTSI